MLPAGSKRTRLMLFQVHFELGLAPLSGSGDHIGEGA